LRGRALLNMHALVAAGVVGILWQGKDVLIEHERMAAGDAGIIGQGAVGVLAHFCCGDVGVGAGACVTLAGHGQNFAGQSQRLGLEDLG